MKKVKIIALIIVFILATVMLGTNDKKYYIKKEHFNNVEQVLDKMNNNNLINSKWNRREGNSDTFNECLSRRKRLTQSDLYCVRMKIIENETLSKSQKDKIIKEYYKRLQNYKNTGQKITRIEPVRFKARLVNMNIYSNNPGIKEEDKYDDEIITFVLIDEGEGFVIDYISESSLDEKETGCK